ncbi:PREDICTED: adenosine receptor A2b-like [Nicrophorus vespilloides]|uniref:Adenosine receptor A2b-like n=1 Tax=Nicrophorus vespilloides TaxID=110193 RepID=A0ABM1MKT5_NICVS|nr:PREDICTED: adenosine receptor A2b-like [Nicrophorus vespilloides]
MSNNTQQALVFYTVSLESTAENVTDFGELLNFASYMKVTSPVVIITAILLVFIFSPTIIIGNSVVLISIYRFKRLRTPSNYLVLSLATSDLGIGMFMPVGMYLELCGSKFISARMCLLNYGVLITLCCVSVLLMVAIAVDRFTSLARPLRYNNLITHTAVERYIGVFWIFSIVVGLSPFCYYSFNEAIVEAYDGHCSFGNLVARPIQLFMFCAVYGPSACILVICYGYIYMVARGHAKAILEVRHSLHYAHSSSTPRYGIALAITTGMFLTLWLPFQVCMLVDVFMGTSILSHWVVIYLALPILSNSAFNPWIYGYRNAELRFAVHKVIEDILTLLGHNYRSQQLNEQPAPSIAATFGDEHASYRKEECIDWKQDLLLVPIAKPESSGLISESDTKMQDRAPRMKGSRSMVETFAIHNGGDFWIITDKNLGRMNGASVV